MYLILFVDSCVITGKNKNKANVFIHHIYKFYFTRLFTLAWPRQL